MKHSLVPHITEKSYRGIQEDAKTSNTYTFKVDPKTSKEYVKKLVEDQFKVTVIDVRTVSIPGKARRFKGIPGRTSDIKKAIVRLAAGQKIAAFDIESADTNQDKE